MGWDIRFDVDEFVVIDVVVLGEQGFELLYSSVGAEKG